MKTLVKEFSALSFEEGRLTGDGPPVQRDSQPRQTRDSVQDFDVRPDGSAVENAPQPESLATTRRWEPQVVLLLTSDPWLRESIRRALPRCTELLMPVLNAEQAVRLSRTSLINAILLDLDSGPDDGWRAAEQLLSGDAAVPLVLLAKQSGSLELRAAVRAGIVLEKPVDSARFLQMVGTLLSQSKDERLQHNARQHNFLRYAHPFAWHSPVPSTPRYWGLNE